MISPLMRIVLLSLAALLGGCVSWSYGDVRYMRVGSTEVDGVEIRRPDGTVVVIQGYGSEGTAVVEATAAGVARGLRR